MGTSFSRNIENPIFSLRIVKVFANSPGFKAGLEPFLDFIIEIQTSNNEKVSFTQISDNSISSLVLADFSRIISENANKILIFSLFNVYSQKSRKVQIIPSRDWENSDSFLGILVRLEEIANSLEKTYRVLNVLKDSPAEKSGLLAESDFILGLTYNKYQDIKEFIEILEEEEEKDKEICVFNEKSGEVRHISLKINKDWGGKGILGCEFGFGIRNQLKPGLENVESSKEIVGEKEKSPGFEKSNNEDTSKHQKMMGISEKAKKLKIPPKNPFNYAKKTSFEKGYSPKSLFFLIGVYREKRERFPGDRIHWNPEI